MHRCYLRMTAPASVLTGCSVAQLIHVHLRRDRLHAELANEYFRPVEHDVIVRTHGSGAIEGAVV